MKIPQNPYRLYKLFHYINPGSLLAIANLKPCTQYNNPLAYPRIYHVLLFLLILGHILSYICNAYLLSTREILIYLSNYYFNLLLLIINIPLCPIEQGHKGKNKQMRPHQNKKLLHGNNIF